MGMIVKKRQLLTATLIIALGAAVAVNWYYNSSDFNTDVDDTTVNESVSGKLGDSILVAGTVEYQETKPAESDSKERDSYFSQAKLRRSESNDEVLDTIEEILEKDSMSKQDVTELEKLFNEYKNVIKWQSDAENLILSKTGNECIVIINENACQVIMKKNTLNDTIILQITEIIEKNTNISAENLSIIEIK